MVPGQVRPARFASLRVGTRRADRGKTIYFFPSSYTLAHISRMLEVARVLRDRGHDVAFCGERPDHPRSKMGFAVTAGFRHVYVKEYYFPYFWDRFEKHGGLATAWDLMRHQKNHARLDELLDAQVKLIKRDRPDMVVGDGTLTLGVAAHIAQVPAAVILNSYLLRYGHSLSPVMHLLRVLDKIRFAPIRKRVYTKYGQEHQPVLKVMRATPAIAPDLPELKGASRLWENFHLVGPIRSDMPFEMPPWYGELTDGTPNVYITMGSTGLLDRFLRRSYDAFAKTPYRFVVTTAGQASPETMSIAPPNFRFAKYAPGEKIMEHCQALIYHGGTGTMYQGLAAGLPMIALPAHTEQRLASVFLEKNGYGLRLSPRSVSGEECARALDRIIDTPSYRKNAQALAPLVRDADGARRAAEVIEQYAAASAIAQAS